MNYAYIELEENERQYDGIDFTTTKSVNAVYVRAKCKQDQGNPYIECLPTARTESEVLTDYHKPILDYSSEQRNWTDYDRMKAVMQLREVRFVLPFHIMLEQEFGLALLNSYRNRHLAEKNGMSIMVNDQDSETNYVSEKRLGAAINAGVALLGYSGCGKTTAIGMTLSNYPQVVVHHDQQGQQFTQIVYLYVVCAANSNFKALYQSIGKAIDRALGNTCPIYEEVINRCRSIGAKTNKICELIDLFGIGAIILDEVQLMDFEGTHENSFCSLMNIVNNTQVALILIGTEEACSKMLPKLQIARRAGAWIVASSYCENKDAFKLLCRQLFQYQWFDSPVELTDEIINTLYTLSRGIVDQLISLYIYMHIHYLRLKTKPIIDSKYITAISKKYFPGLQELLSQLVSRRISETSFERSAKTILSDADKKLEDELEAYRVKNETERIAQAFRDNEIRNYDQILRNVVVNIRNTLCTTGETYSDEAIMKAAKQVMSQKQNYDADEKKLTQQTYQRLTKKPAERKSKAKRAVMDENHIHMRDMLLKSS